MGSQNESIDVEQTKDTEERLQWHCVRHKEDYNCTNECFLQKVLHIFGKRHSLSIIRTLLRYNKLRFNELQKEVGGSPKTITERLRELELNGILIREVFNEIPVRVEYSLTELGKDLEDIFERISNWAANWVANK
jgi:DNA-binding HxlR family transcriptional regulator